MSTPVRPSNTSVTLAATTAAQVTYLLNDLASALRSSMPELSDEDLGRALVELGEFVAHACDLHDQQARGIAEHVTRTGRELLHAPQGLP